MITLDIDLELLRQLHDAHMRALDEWRKKPSPEADRRVNDARDAYLDLLRGLWKDGAAHR